MNLNPGTEMLMGSLKMSALHLAAREGNVECVSILLGAGADPRSRYLCQYLFKHQLGRD